MTNAPIPIVQSSRTDAQIRSVQALRAVAALVVVAFHATVMWHDKFDATVKPWENGNAGVDLFFVISGFIMVVSSRRLLHVALGWRRFLLLRLVRVTPLYWLATLVKLASLAAVPGLVLHTRPDATNILASFMFVPSYDAAGVLRPVLDVGWTLSFEMLFYLVFAWAMFLQRGVLATVAPVMLLLSLASLVVRPHSPAITSLANPIVLEFVFGLVIGRFAGLLSRRAPALWVAAAACGLACLLTLPADGPWLRTAIWGSAAAFALLASVVAEGWVGPYVPQLVVRTGEASYSLYLAHGFVLPLVGLAVARSGLHGWPLGTVLISTSLVVSTLTALVIYRAVEVPMTTWLRRLTHDRGRTALAAPATPI